MPELPEVESLRRSLLPFLIGKKILKVQVLLPKLVSGNGTIRKVSPKKVTEFVSGVEGRKIKSITRRAKNLIITLDDQGIILIHLKMTGQLAYQDIKNNVLGGHPIQESESTLPNKHSYIIFELDKGNLYYNDVRQFGYLLYYPNLKTLESQNHFQNLGLEPLTKDFTLDAFTKDLKKKTGVIKKILLDQQVVVGLGNIYADESLFLAGIRPYRKASSLTKKEVEKLFEAILEILPKAVAMGGSSVANYIMADGKRGTYAREHKVYKRGGDSCLHCGTVLKKTVVAGRTTVYCPVDQK